MESGKQKNFPLFLLPCKKENDMKKTGGKSTKSVVSRVEEFTRPVVEELGYILWDIEFEKVGSLYELCVYIDLADRTVDISDCEKVSLAVDPLLDRYDPIDEQYTFYVSSAGLERTLKYDWHYEACLGEPVEIKLYKPLEGTKVRVLDGVLKAYEDGMPVVAMPDGSELRVPAENIAKARLRVEF